MFHDLSPQILSANTSNYSDIIILSSQVVPRNLLAMVWVLDVNIPLLGSLLYDDDKPCWQSDQGPQVTKNVQWVQTPQGRCEFYLAATAQRPPFVL